MDFFGKTEFSTSPPTSPQDRREILQPGCEERLLVYLIARCTLVLKRLSPGKPKSTYLSDLATEQGGEALGRPAARSMGVFPPGHRERTAACGSQPTLQRDSMEMETQKL